MNNRQAWLLAAALTLLLGSRATIAGKPEIDPSYADGKVSISYNMNGFVLGVAYNRTYRTGTSNFYINPMGNNLGRSKVVFSFTRTY